jgi:hypothetical protein
MATSPLQPIVFNQGLTTSWATLYTVPADKLGAGIDAVVLNNYTAASQNYSIRLIQTGTPSDLNEVITELNVRAKSNNLATAMIGQALVTGGIIQAKASADSSININITATIVDS